MNGLKLRKKILYKSALCRYFEYNIFELIKNKKINFPVYFSAGQEYVASSIAAIFQEKKIKPLLFGQHRCHSIYIAFGGELRTLVKEFFGSKNGCSYVMGGSLSLHSKKINMYGHEGFMGSNVCIGIGAAFASKKPTIIFIGDAAVEEDYVLAAISWIAKKKLPVLIVVEDNNFAITTPKEERRDWKVKDLGNSLKIESDDCNDDPVKIRNLLKNYYFKKPRILNIHTNRLFWHAGAGIDNGKVFDRMKSEIKKLGNIGKKIEFRAQSYINSIFNKLR
jgi:TPP-dependent pyruvate/acetoin dehydrogenase alpha subunit